MDILVWLIPISLFLGGIGLVGFIWTVKTDQYDDPEGRRNGSCRTNGTIIRSPEGADAP